jgi:hypothetical protein
MFAAGKTATPSGGGADAQFNYVTMLLHGDGTNGAQNNTFLDSSTNNFTITRNGNTTQGSFSPYGSNWSNYFNGSSDYLSLGTSTNLALGAGDFTIEVWLSVTAYNASTSNIFEWRSAGGTPSNIPTLYLSASGVPIFYASVGAGALITGSSAVALNTWTHLAIVRNGSTVTMYLNGTSVGSATNSADLGTQSFYINDPQGTFRHNGYFSNVRIVKGTAVYTGSFTPSTTPLTAITNTQLLTCQSNRFIDNSTNAFAITVTGTPSVQRFNPFGTATAYDTSVIGGSGYFDGSGDYLLTPATSALEFGSGDFTLEFWFYVRSIDRQALYAGSFGIDWSIGIDYSSVSANQTIGVWASSSGSSWNLLNADGGGNGIGTITLKQNAWNYIVYQRSGNTWSTYINGVRDVNVTVSGTIVDRSSYQKAIGAWWSAGAMGTANGYISGFRAGKTAVYSGTTMTVPIAPVTAITNTQLLLNYTNGAIFDNAMMNDLETVGNAQISTSVVKYGTGSLAFDGTGDGVVANSQNIYSFGTGNFTVEFWVNITSFSSNRVLFDIDNSNILQLYTNTSGVLNYYTPSSDRISSSALSTATWYHIALCRSGTSTKLFIDGTQAGSTYTDSTNYAAGGVGVGSRLDGTISLNGYIDDLRITKGYARYTTTFTPPTSALSDTGPI